MSTPTACPRCGHPRQGVTRFCTGCAFDYWKAAEGAEQPPIPSSHNDARTRGLSAVIVGVVVLLFAILAGGVYAVLTGEEEPVGQVAGQEDGDGGDGMPPVPRTPRPTPDRTPDQRASDCVADGGRWSTAREECVHATPVPVETPGGTLLGVAVGETVTITCGGDDCLEVTVSDPSFHQVYVDPDGYFNDEPQIDGHVFMQVFVEYVALDDAATFNQFDWQVFADGRLVDDWAFASNGPEPQLGSGQLPAGRTASGWLLYEVPAAGEIILAYAPNYDGPPVFEITIRD